MHLPGRNARSMVTIAAFMAFAIGHCSPVSAGPVLDWLFGTSSTPDPAVVAYYPTPTGYQAFRVLPGQVFQTPVVSYQRPWVEPAVVGAPRPMVATNQAGSTPGIAYRVSGQTSFQPTTRVPFVPTTTTYRIPSTGPTGSAIGSQAGTVCCSPSPVVYSPVPARPSWLTEPAKKYRTTWKQVRVTAYRPVTTTDPVTGYPVTVMRPCSTYEWQLRRQEEGFFDRLFGRFRSSPSPTLSTCDPRYTVIASDCNACPVGAPPSGAANGYYIPGSTTSMPTGGAPAGSFLNPSIGGSGVPSLAPPPGAGNSGNSADGADRRPSLKPDTAPSGPDLTAPAGPKEGANSDASDAGVEKASQLVPLPPRATATDGPNAVRPAGVPPSINGPALRPVPDPDADATGADATGADEMAAPALLNPRDRTAVLRSDQRWAFTAIHWPRRSDDPPARRPVARPVQSKTVPAPSRRTVTTVPSAWRTVGR